MRNCLLKTFTNYQLLFFKIILQGSLRTHLSGCSQSYNGCMCDLVKVRRRAVKISQSCSQI